MLNDIHSISITSICILCPVVWTIQRQPANALEQEWDQMESLIDRIRAGLDGGLYPNERAVSTSIVVPILRALGWDDSDPAQVMPEYTNPRGRVDYALSPSRNSPAVFVEVKRVGQTADADKQLFEYAFHEGAQIAVLTDGRLWNFYLPGQHGSYEDRRVYQLDIVERETAEIVLRFRRYLDRTRVAGGAALNDAQTDYHASASRRAAELTLPKAWAQLLAEPDGLLIELLRERTEALCGHKPNDTALEHFLRGQQAGTVKVSTGMRSPKTRVASAASPSLNVAAELNVAQTDIEVAPAEGRNRWRVGSVGGVERNGVDTMVALLSAMFRLYPDRQENMAAAVRTRGRNNIARTIDEIYPNQPQIARRNNRQLPDGWHVGTNESSATKKRIVTQATRGAGLSMKTDVEFDL